MMSCQIQTHEIACLMENSLLLWVDETAAYLIPVT